jgi:glycosyltransferase involved in cell wall biosynthesis
MNILVVTPRSPFTLRGADERDRYQGITDLIRLGHSVSVFTRTFPGDEADILRAKNALGISIVSVPYKTYTALDRMRHVCRFSLMDGAAAAYADPEVIDTLTRFIDQHSPDIGWIDYTYLTPIFPLFETREIPFVVRSINFEPRHYLYEDGTTPITLIKVLPKLWSEYQSVIHARSIAAITPYEEVLYRRIRARSTYTLPLRDLPNLLREEPVVRRTDTLTLGCIGSNYSISHNRAALEFMVKDVMPILDREAPGTFVLNVTGRKVPKDILALENASIVFRGFVEDMNAFFTDIDIGVSPSLSGAGMQQKIFEPLCRGIPTVTSSRGIGGYAIEEGKEILIANTPRAFADHLLSLRDYEMRADIAEKGLRKAQALFSRETIDAITSRILESSNAV